MNVERVLNTKGSTSVLSIPPTSTLREFAKQASERNVGALLVTGTNGDIIGIISERDILHQCSAGADLDHTPVSDVMTRNVICVSPGDDLHKAMDLMVTKAIRHLPVVDNGQIRGFITVRDIMRAMRQAEEDDIRYLITYLQDSMKAENVSL